MKVLRFAQEIDQRPALLRRDGLAQAWGEFSNLGDYQNFGRDIV